MAYTRTPNTVIAGQALKQNPAPAPLAPAGALPVVLDADIATTTNLGVVQIGAGLAITPEGILSTDGQVGYTGSAGENGFTGSTGFTGSAGENGFTGSTGFTGSAGENGFTGSTGFTGSAGENGFTGSAGEHGFTGSTGFTGSAGEHGFTGSTGFTGSAGEHGFTGSTGFVGSVGFVGSRGFTGSTGFTGSIGIGYTGSAGKDDDSKFVHVKLTSNDYTATSSDYYIGATNGGIDITLPLGLLGRIYVIKNQDNSNVKVFPTNPNTIDGSSSKTLGSNVSITVVFDGTRWQTI
jgi:hypothetical protein